MKSIKEIDAIRKDVGLSEWDCGQAEALRDVLKLIDEYLEMLSKLKNIEYPLEFILLQFEELKSKIEGK